MNANERNRGLRGGTTLARWGHKTIRVSSRPFASIRGVSEGVTVQGLDLLLPNRGEVRSDGPDGIACWFVDTDFTGENFFVRFG